MTDGFKPMLAKDADPANLAFPLWVQPKLDGIRISIVDGRALTRTLKEIPNKQVSEALSRPELNGLDGEILVGDPTAEDAYRTTVSFVMSRDKTDEPWVFYVFDKWDHPGNFAERYSAAQEQVMDVEESLLSLLKPTDRVCHEHIRWVENHIVDSIERLNEVEIQYTDEGYEGVIVRTNQPYKFGRSGKKGPLLKVKRWTDFEAEVLEQIERLHNANEAKTNALGRTERSSHKENKIPMGTLGALRCKALNGTYKGQEFNVGTGLDDALRQHLWDNPIVGQIIKVKSFEVGAKDKPRHPVYIGVRDMSLDG